MAFTYRKQMTPGMKMCKDIYVDGKKAKEEKKEVIKDVPPQVHKLKK
jgi:hypothetical protein